MVADTKEDLQKTLQEWSNTFRKHGLQMNLEKTEVMWIGEQEVDLHVVVDGKTIKQVNSFVYLGDTVCEDGGSSKEIQRRVQAGAAATKRKSVGSLHCTSLYIWVGNTGTDRETGGEDADSRKQLQRICKVTQEDRRKMKELRGDWHEKTPKD